MSVGAARILIEGEVQGVGFRYLVRRIARRIGIVGHVRNLPDGRVEIICEGLKEKLELFISQVNVKKPPVNVETVDVTFKKATGRFRDFRIAAGRLSDEMIEGFSTGAALFDVMFERQDKMLQMQDETVQEIRALRLRQDETLQEMKALRSVQDETVQEIRALRSDLKAFLDERLSRMEKDIAEIKAKVGLI